MTFKFSVATTSGRLGIARPAETREHEWLKDLCRDGAMAVSISGRHCSVYVDPSAQATSDEWRTALNASLASWCDPVTLNVLCLEEWHRSSHPSIDELVAVVSAWIGLSSPRGIHTARFVTTEPTGLRRVGWGEQAETPLDPPWIEPLVRTLATSAATSAHHLCDLIADHVAAQEAVLAALNLNGGTGSPTLDWFDHHCPNLPACQLYLGRINCWLIECHVTGRAIVSAPLTHFDGRARTVAVAATRLVTTAQELVPAVAAVLV